VSSWIDSELSGALGECGHGRATDRLIELGAQIAELVLELAGDLAAQRLGLFLEPLLELADRGVAQAILCRGPRLLGDARLEVDLFVEPGIGASLTDTVAPLEIDR